VTIAISGITPPDDAVSSPLGPLLDGAPWSRALSDAERARLARETVVRELPADGLVCRKGERVEHWIGVVDGLVKIASVSAEGKAMTYTGVPSGGWLGEGSLLKDEPRRYDVVALRASRIAFMPRATFQWLLDTSIGFNRFLLRQLNERLGQFIAMVEYERLLGPDARVARCLAQLFNPILYPGLGPRLEISQAEIGFLTGLSRQRANQALQALEAAGLLRVEYGGITVVDLDGLRALEDPPGG
jgi:CRP-like cAMP-binding protein